MLLKGLACSVFKGPLIIKEINSCTPAKVVQSLHRVLYDKIDLTIILGKSARIVVVWSVARNTFSPLFTRFVVDLRSHTHSTLFYTWTSRTYFYSVTRVTSRNFVIWLPTDRNGMVVGKVEGWLKEMRLH